MDDFQVSDTTDHVGEIPPQVELIRPDTWKTLDSISSMRRVLITSQT